MEIKTLVGQMNPYAKKKVHGADKPEQTTKTDTSSGGGSDKVMLSEEAKLRGAALQSASEAPDVRKERVRELKEKVQNGTYKPDLKKAAANLIRDDLDLLV